MVLKGVEIKDVTPEIGGEKYVKMFNLELLNVFYRPTLINVAQQVCGETTHAANGDNTPPLKLCL